MGRNRNNDFSERTKQLAGRSVLFRCCFPNCNRPLISRKENTLDIQNCAEYAHIVAASPGGPRFDPNMSSEDIKSYDNCIVLCGIHHKIVDDNPNDYSVSKLKEWKSIAEERTRKEMMIHDNYKNGEELEAVIISLIKTGDFDIAYTKINDFKDVQNHVYNEIIVRYKIIMNSMFKKANEAFIDEYLKLGYKNVDFIVKKMIEYADLKSLKIILNNIDNKELKEVVEKILFIHNNNTDNQKKIDEILKIVGNDLYIKFAMNYFFSYTDLYLYFYDSDKNKLPFYEEESFYKVISFALQLRESILIANDLSQSELEISALSEYISTIDLFDQSVKLLTYKYILIFLASINSDLFEKYYNRLSEEEKTTKEILDIYYHRIIDIDPLLPIDEILDYSDKSGDYKNLCIYLSVHPQQIKQIIDDHMYLLKKDSTFILLYKNYIDNDTFLEKITELKTFFKDDFLFNCILWNININEENIKKWCIKNKSKLSNFSINIFLSNLVMSHEDECFFEMIDSLRDIDIKANYLLMFHSYNQENNFYDKKLLSYYENINNKKMICGVNYNMAILYWNFGKHDLAFKCICSEIDNFPSSNARKLLFDFRLKKNIYLKDKYFTTALNSSDFYELAYVAEVFYNNNELNYALNYYEKALITGVNNDACLFKIFELTCSRGEVRHVKIEDNTVVRISNFQDSHTIAFHKKSIYDGIIPGNNKWIDACLDSTEFCDFYSIEIGENVTYKGEEYKVESIIDLYEYFSKLEVSNIMANPSSISINNMNELFDFVDKRNKLLNEKYSKYIEIKNVLPLSISSKMFFDNKILSNISFLSAESDDKLMNNIKKCPCDLKKLKMLFNFDSIYFLYHLKDYFSDVIISNFYITDIVKNRFINEINDELRDIELGNGKIHIDNGKNMVLYGEKYNASRRSYLIKLKDFIEQFTVIQSDGFEFIIDGSELKNFDFPMDEEKSILSVQKKDSSFILVSDIYGLNQLCDLYNYANVGIIQFLAAFVDHDKIIDVSFKLKEFNFNNYFTYDMYLSCIGDGSNRITEFLNKKFESDKDNVKHKLIILAIIKELSILHNIDSNRDIYLIKYMNECYKKQ